MSIAGIVVAGGAGVRLGGAAKADIELDGSTLLERALAALGEVEEIVVAGDPVPTSRTVTFVREEPAGGGPAAGLLAALDGFARQPAQVLVLAVDMPRVTPATFRRLMLEAGPDGAVLIDNEGRRQFLCGVYSLEALRRADPGPEKRTGLSMRALVDPLRLSEVPAVGAEAADIDTWDDLLRQREAD